MADVTLFPPTSILTNHSHQIYHHPTPPSSGGYGFDYSSYPQGLGIPFIEMPRLLSGFIQDNAGSSSRNTTTTYLRPAQPPIRRHPTPCSHTYLPKPPADGSSPLLALPDELLLCVFSHLPLESLLRLRRTCPHFTQLALHPSLHRSLSLYALPPSPLPLILTKHIIPSIRHLHLNLFPLPTPSSISSSPTFEGRENQPTNRILALSDLIPADQLISLSLPFSAPFLPSADLGAILGRVGGKLEKLDLRGSAVEGVEYLEWMAKVGIKNRYGGLRELDLGFTPISSLPIPSILDDAPEDRKGCWDALKHLSLASCSSLSSTTLASFLTSLPTSIETLDLSRLEQVTYTALDDLLVVDEEKETPTQLKEIKLVGIDHLTRSNIRSLKKHWQAQRLSILPTPPPLFTWNTITPKQQKVWGEPHTPLPEASLPRLIPTTSWIPSTPDLIPHSSSSISTNNSSFQSSFSRPSALSTHSALWNALSQDAEEGIHASPGVWKSKLPQHPYLPSKGLPKADWAWNTEYTPRCPPIAPIADDRGIEIKITHSAILESEDEEGYRMFIGEVSGASTLPSPTGLGLGIGAELSGLGMGLFGGMGGWGGDGGSVGGYAREGEEYLDELAGF